MDRRRHLCGHVAKSSDLGDAITASHREIVEGIYSSLLKRSPDADALKEKVERLKAGTADIALLINEIMDSQEFVGRLAVLAARKPQSRQGFTNDVSQDGEVFALLKLVINDSVKTKWVVDVGARGVDRSNSFDLLRHFGWRGLLVEANPCLIEEIQDGFANTDFVLVNCAVANKEGHATFTIGVNDDVSSLNSACAEAWGVTRGTVDVEMRRLPHILAEHHVPEEFGLLSIDIEGEDISVLNDLIDNSAYRPQWIIIEASFDFSIRSLQDGPFSNGVRSRYSIRWQNAANLILSRR